MLSENLRNRSEESHVVWLLFFFFMVTVEIIERVHMEEEQTPLLWLCAACSNLFFMVLNFLPFVG